MYRMSIIAEQPQLLNHHLLDQLIANIHEMLDNSSGTGRHVIVHNTLPCLTWT